MKEEENRECISKKIILRKRWLVLYCFPLPRMGQFHFHVDVFFSDFQDPILCFQMYVDLMQFYSNFSPDTLQSLQG